MWIWYTRLPRLNPECAQYATNAILATDLCDCKDFEEIAKIIANSNDSEKAKLAFEYLDDYIDDEDILSTVKILINAKSAKRAQYAFDVLADEDVRKYNLQVPLARSVANARSDTRAFNAYYTAVNSVVLHSDIAESLTKLIAQAKGDNQAEIAGDIVSNFTCNKEDLPVIKAITKMEHINPSYGSPNGENIDAALAFFHNSENIDEKAASIFLDVLFDKDNYIKFIDYYKKNPKGALEALKNVTKTCNQEFGTGKTYVKIPNNK